jgi:hypothetical protein
MAFVARIGKFTYVLIDDISNHRTHFECTRMNFFTSGFINTKRFSNLFSGLTSLGLTLTVSQVDF